MFLVSRWTEISYRRSCFTILSNSELVQFSALKWLIYVPRPRRILWIMNQTNGTGDLDCRGVICLFMRVSISRESCAKADFRAIILGPCLGTLRVIGIYYTLEVFLPASSFVWQQEVPLLPERCKPILIVWPSSNPRRRLSHRETKVNKVLNRRVPVIKNVRLVLSHFSS